MPLQNSPGGPLVNPEFFADRNASKYELYLKIEEAGYYMGQVKYNNQKIGPQWFGLVSLIGKIRKLPYINFVVIFACIVKVFIFEGLNFESLYFCGILYGIYVSTKHLCKCSTVMQAIEC